MAAVIHPPDPRIIPHRDPRTHAAWTSSDSGIFLQESDAATLIGNDVRFNTRGIEMNTSSGNRVESNNASNSNGTGIELEDAFATVLLLNRANANKARGIFVDGEAKDAGDEDRAGNLLDQNTADDNRGDGIVLAKGGHTITGNAAHRNDGWGIYASPGTIDGGGNAASGNKER